MILYVNISLLKTEAQKKKFWRCQDIKSNKNLVALGSVPECQ